MEKMMKRYFEEDKEVLWEADFRGSLYSAYAGSKGIYRSNKDGKYFFAEHHTNAMEYTGKDYLVILPENIAKEALAKKYHNDRDEYDINPEYALIEMRYR